MRDRKIFLPMKDIYLWFYCLPIVDAVLLVLLTTAGFLLLCWSYKNKGWWKPAMAGVLGFWLVVVLWATLGGRAHVSSEMRTSLIPFASYATVLQGGNPELIREKLMNMILFYPAGLLAAGLVGNSWSQRSKILLVLACCGEYGH